MVLSFLLSPHSFHLLLCFICLFKWICLFVRLEDYYLPTCFYICLPGQMFGDLFPTDK